MATTGHAEVIQVTFDPAQLSYRDLLKVFFATHDPTTLNRQGHDVGTQYRSVIFTHSAEQEATAQDVIRELGEAAIFDKPIVTEVTPLSGPFYPAEAALLHGRGGAQGGQVPKTTPRAAEALASPGAARLAAPDPGTRA